MDYIDYFAYGSNMLYRVINSRRGIQVIQNNKAIVYGWALKFNCPGFNKYEPAFANIVLQENAQVEGVLYRLSKKEFFNMVKTEGDLYDVVDISAYIGNNNMLTAKTLVSREVIEENQPSERYLNLLIAGAKENKLSDTYINKLAKTKYKPMPPGYKAISWVVSLYLRIRFFLLRNKP